MVALACDFRVMNAERGFLCTNELNIGLAFQNEMMELFKAKVPTQAVVPLLLAGERLPAERCLTLGLIERAVPGSGLGAAALDIAAHEASKGAKKDLLKFTKTQLFGDAAAVMHRGSVSGLAMSRL
mmetsp:Transcript_1762/g.3710  ORF Transcript_1762/g.3710 Transcript_1762/m.3710 type:complete len:126 (+) Transcript_1762:541-918(+)